MSAVTETSRGPLVNVATWITVSTMAIAVVSKIAVRWSVMRKFQPDDFLLTLAAILAIGQSIATSSEVQSGLGRHESTLTPDELQGMLKSQYASGFLYLSAVFVTKLAGFAFFVSLMGPMVGRAVTIIRTLAAFCLLWMLAGFFAIAFQCRLPTPWEYGTGLCINKPAFWTATAVVDIATQIMVSFIPAFLLKDLQTSTARRMLAMFSFTPNLLTIPLVVLRLLFIYGQDKLVDRSWDWYNVVLLTSIHAQMAIMLGAIPFLKPLIDSMVVLPAVIPNDGDLTAVDDSTAGSSLKPHQARWVRSLSAFTTHSSTAGGAAPGTSSSKQHFIQRNKTTVEAAGPSPSAHDRSSLPADAEHAVSLDSHRMTILQTREFAVTS